MAFLLQRLDRSVREGGARLLERLVAGGEIDEGEVQFEGACDGFQY